MSGVPYESSHREGWTDVSDPGGGIDPDRPTSPTPTTGRTSSTSEVAGAEAGQVKATAVDAGRDVAATAKGEAQDVAAELGDRATDLVGTALGEVRTQAQDQQQRLVGGMHTAASELGDMASSSQQSGIATEVTQQVSQRLEQAASWLEHREPSDVLEEVRGFARRQPVAFLVGAGLAGLVVGRLARGVVANRTELDTPSGSRDTTPAPAYREGAVTSGRDATGYSMSGSPRVVEQQGARGAPVREDGVPGPVVAAPGTASGEWIGQTDPGVNR